MKTPGSPLVLLEKSTATQPSASRIPIGRLGDEFVVYEVRRGGMGEVYICGTNNDDAPRLALKTFNKKLFFEPCSREAFVHEAAIWSRLSGIPHIMITLGVRMIDERPFVVMPAIQGRVVNIAELTARHRLTPEEVYHFSWQVSFGLAKAHQKIPNLVHGDLKPGNLLLMNGDVFISDFGLARVIAAGDSSHSLVSTWAYRAPECWAAPETLSVASDIYAFGLTLHELLGGSSLSEDATVDQWREWHRSGTPTYTEEARSKLELELRVLAKTCIEKDRRARPINFQEVLRSIEEIGESDVLQKLVTVLRASKWKEVFSQMQAELRPNMIRSLLEIGAYDAALQELNDLPQDIVVGDIAALHGTALSLNNLDVEALKWFDRALESGPNDDDRSRYLSEKALSLKRLGRFQEAIAIYGKLMDAAADRFDPRLVVNLATVFITANQPIKARDLLRSFVRERPDVPEAWCNLGIAYEKLKDFDPAVQAYQRALSLNAMMDSAQVGLARVFLQLRRVSESAALLYAAYAQGHRSVDWLIHTVAANTLLEEAGEVALLLNSATESLGSEKMAEVNEEVAKLVRHVSEASELSPAADTEPDARPEDNQRPSTTSHMPSNDQVEKFSFPFFNTRMYLDEAMYSIDFYDDVTKAGYADSFYGAWQTSQRDPRYQLEGMTLRSQPLYFTRCPGCHTFILTNRDIGKLTRCRCCDQHHETSPETATHLANLLDQVEQRIGRSKYEIIPGGLVHILLCQHESAEQLQAAEGILEDFGFKRVEESAPVIFWLLDEGSKRGQMKHLLPSSAWRLDHGNMAASYKDHTPPAIDKVLRIFRSRHNGIRTLSTSLDTNEKAQKALLGSVSDLYEQLADTGGQMTPDVEAEFKLAKGDTEGAWAIADRILTADKDSTRALQILGRVALKREDWNEAAAYLERAAALDPLDRNVLTLLVACYRRTDQRDRAAEVWSRLARVGGPIFGT